jgi:EAL domain-containing protein (putative c-di-GMP-specific phosphodiesterase class I)
VVLELTETRLMTDAIKCLETLTRLRLKGFELSIDDFGTGHSSLAQLQRIPFTELKVDRAFVHGASRDEVARSILDSSLSLARRLGLRTVAEGAETQEDWDLVAALGVDLVQGYFVSRPLPGDRVPAWFEAWNNRA